jgi:aspartate/methionine/tyrosine aminotransferase
LPLPNTRYERAVSFGTLSKAYGLPGLRVGWCVAPEDVLDKCVRLRDYVSLHLSPLVELLARRAIEKADVLIGLRLTQLRLNLDIVAEWVERQQGLVEWSRPLGGACAFVRMPFVTDAEEFCRQLAYRHRVLLVPGTCFGYPQHARLGFGCSPHALKEGLARLSAWLETSADARQPEARGKASIHAG